jgi:ribonuclease P protein component
VRSSRAAGVRAERSSLLKGDIMADPGALDRSNRQPEENAPSAYGRSETLSRHQRITNGEVFRRAFDDSKPQVGKFMVLRLTNGEGADRRLGVIASKRTYPRAVDRARARRLLREAFRHRRDHLESEADVVILARRHLLSATPEEIESELLALAKRALQ